MMESEIDFLASRMEACPEKMEPNPGMMESEVEGPYGRCHSETGGRM
jgi:hypothetical protein